MGDRLLLRWRLRDRSRGEYDRRAFGLLERPLRGERDLSRCHTSVDRTRRRCNARKSECEEGESCWPGRARTNALPRATAPVPVSTGVGMQAARPERPVGGRGGSMILRSMRSSRRERVDTSQPRRAISRSGGNWARPTSRRTPSSGGRGEVEK